MSIRTLEKQIRRLKASAYQELRDLGDEIASRCTEPAACGWSADDVYEPVAPTLARFVDPDEYPRQAKQELRQWAVENLPAASESKYEDIDLLRPSDTLTDTAACLLYEVTNRPYRELYETLSGWSEPRRMEVIDTALRSRTRRDEMLRSFRGGPYVYDIVMDIGAYRDMHRHRRCIQLRQDYGTHLGFSIPQPAIDAGIAVVLESTFESALASIRQLPAPASDYALPFATNARFLFKMDFAEAEYICRLRSGVKGHFSYRAVAWGMKCAMERLEPALGRLISATPPSVEDPLKR